MKPVDRSEILDYVTYSERRDALRPALLAAKAARRVLVEDGTLVFLFENRDTVRYQVHEMMRTERIVKETDIAHELETYNELIGGEGELGCTLLIGIDDESERDEKLRAWVGLCEHLYALVDDQRIRPTFDARQVGETRLSAVQYLKFAVGPVAPTAMGCDHPELTVEHKLTPEQYAALSEDLAAP
ncbi:MAG: DUF3501 family protein [Nannocystaceae bacterium]|nr:DUF3501 family protein [Nannocystaceae bacterium]